SRGFWSRVTGMRRRCRYYYRCDFVVHCSRLNGVFVNVLRFVALAFLWM
ncbi:24704_t:CDS:1, partial [Racocetra persica]